MDELRVSWEAMDDSIRESVDAFREINSGIHVAILGTTRGGKTTLVTGGGDPKRSLLRHFPDCLILDSTADPGYLSNYGKPISKYGAIRGHQRLTVSDMSMKSKEKMHKYISKAVAQGNVAIYVDELRQVTEKKYFGLGPTMDYLWLFGAKKGVSVIGGTQAPRWIPSAFYDQSKLHFIFKTRDERSMKRLAEISGDVNTLRNVIPNLDRYEFAHVNLEGDVSISRFELGQKTTGSPPVRKVKIYGGSGGRPPNDVE